MCTAISDIITVDMYVSNLNVFLYFAYVIPILYIQALTVCICVCVCVCESEWYANDYTFDYTCTFLCIYAFNHAYL